MDAGTSIGLRSDLLEKLKNALNDSSYRETIESSSNYNNRLVVERKTRIPFIDSQTGVAQNDCYLWMQKWERMPGTTEGQLYSYPKKRWRKKKRSQYLLNSNYGLNLKQWEKLPERNSLELTNGHEAPNEAAPTTKDGPDTVNDKFFDSVIAKEDWMTELEAHEFNEALENDDIESDFDDEDYSSKKKKKKKNDASNSAKKKKAAAAAAAANHTTPPSAVDHLNHSSDKPYKCDLCGMKYKTRPGLSYHYSHTHSLDADRKHLSLDEEDSQQSNSSLTGVNGLNSRSSQVSNSTSNSPLPPNSLNQINSKSNLNNLPSVSPVFNKAADDKSKQKKPTPSSYCDFCLGNSEINKKTRASEEMISCHHCGRSAHPTCLQFTPNMLKSVKKYPWECLECKSCGICGTSDNDDQLLFCDDCDRGYHSHCVGLKEIPEGEWSCNLCLAEYHSNKQPSTDHSTSTAPLNNNNANNKTSANNNAAPASTNSTTPSHHHPNDDTHPVKQLSSPNGTSGTPITANNVNSNKSANSHSNSTAAFASKAAHSPTAKPPAAPAVEPVTDKSS